MNIIILRQKYKNKSKLPNNRQKKWDSAESRNVNLKSNTMKNTLQKYDFFPILPNFFKKKSSNRAIFNTF